MQRSRQALDSVRAIGFATAATRERSRNLRSVSALRASVGLSQGPSEAFIRRSRNPDLAVPWRFEPTVKSEGDIVL